MNRDFIYHESTTSICSECLKRVPAKIILKNNKIFLKKYCNIHGIQEELFEEDIEYHLSKRKFDKPATISKTQTDIKKGCPFDCGLCPNHDQHTCIGLIEITNECNLNCPICYSNSGKGEYLSLEQIDKMLDLFVESENKNAEILQISGGEPTVHPQIIEIIKLARKKKINYVMLNTNGIKIAQDENFVKQLTQFKDKFEIYLQFDGFDEKIYSHLRGKKLLELKNKAINNLIKYNIPTTLVATIEKGINDNQIEKIIEFGLKTKIIRGINFQPIAYFGRSKNKNIQNRITLSGIIKQIETKLPQIFQKEDIVPLPCNVERVAVTYLIKNKEKKFIPITRNIKIENYLPLIDNTFAFDANKVLKNTPKQIIQDNQCCDCMKFIKDVKNVIPFSFTLKSKKEKVNYINENTFRISITSFVDIYNFDLKSIQKECVHIITKDLKKIPFSSYNMFYRK